MSLFYSLLFRKILNEIHAQPVIFHKNFFKKERFFPNGLTFDAGFYIKAKQNNLEYLACIEYKNSMLYHYKNIKDLVENTEQNRPILLGLNNWIKHIELDNITTKLFIFKKQ